MKDYEVIIISNYGDVYVISKSYCLGFANRVDCGFISLIVFEDFAIV